MKIGISVSSSYPEIAPNLAVDWMVARTRAANAAGLDHLFVGDHHSTKTPYFQNNVMLGRMLAEWGDKPFGALYLLPLMESGLAGRTGWYARSRRKRPVYYAVRLGRSPAGCCAGG